MNNAGGQFAAPLEAISLKGMRAVHRLNVDATWDLTHGGGALDDPGAQGFVAFLGFSPRRGVPMMIHSSTARSALETFAAGIAQEWSKYGIRAVCIAAGLIRTEGLPQYGGQDVVDEFATHVPMRRAGLPEEVAATIAFLASPGGALHHRDDRGGGRRLGRLGPRDAPAGTRAVSAGPPDTARPRLRTTLSLPAHLAPGRDGSWPTCSRTTSTGSSWTPRTERGSTSSTPRPAR